MVTRQRWTAITALMGTLLALAGCGTPTPTLIPAATITPKRFVTEIVSPPPTFTLMPTWTVPASRTPQPTFTRFPTSTERPTRTPRPTSTIVGGEPGVLTSDGMLAVLVTERALNEALARERESFYYSADINFAPVLTLQDGEAMMKLNFNDFTAKGIPVDFRLSLRVVNNQLFVDVRGTITESGGSLTANRIELAREIVRVSLVNHAIPDAIRRFEPFLAQYDVLGVQIRESDILITVRVTAATPTPTVEPTVTSSN